MNLPNHRHKKLYQPVRVDKFVNVNLALSTSTLLLMRNILLILPAAVMTGILLSGCDKNSKDEPVSPTLEDIVLDTTDLVLDIGETYTLGVEIYPANADAQLTWMSTDATVASVSDAGKVTANSAGNADITVSGGDITASCKVTVNEAGSVQVTKVTVNPSEVTVKIGETATLTADVEPADAEYTLEWSSLTPDIASVDQDGTVTGLAAGNAVIMAEAGGKTGSCTVTVSAIDVESISLSETSLTMEEGETAVLVAEVLPENATDKTLTWSSSDETVATVNDGTVTAITAGEATITAKAGDKTAECSVTVNEKYTAPVNIGDYFYSDGTWSSELDGNKDVISVIFYAGDITADDAAMAREHPGCTNGLVLALNNVDATGANWQYNYADYNGTVSDWVSSSQTGYEPVNDINKASGYNNTKALEAFNTANPEFQVTAVQSVAAYAASYPAPITTSGWYMPSIKELMYLSAGHFDGNPEEVSSTANLAIVNSSLGNIAGAKKVEGQFLMGFEIGPNYIWSSSEISLSDVAVFSTDGIMLEFPKTNVEPVRCILAF